MVDVYKCYNNQCEKITLGGFNSIVQRTVDALNPNQNRSTKTVCKELTY